MSFSIEILKAVRADAVTKVLEANAQIADIDQTLAVLEGHAVGAPHREVIHAEEAKPFDHVHWGLTEADTVAPPFDNGGDVHVHVAATVTNEPDAPEPVLTPEQFEAASARAQAYLDTLAEEPFEPVPPADELTFSAPPAPEPKSGGRRTNEEIAAEIGVNLEDVKEWKGGGRISRADMEEFKKLHAAAAIPGQQTIDDVDEPSLAEEEYNATIPVSPETIAEVQQVQEQFDAEREQRQQAAPPSYGTADEAVVADDAETFEPPF